MKKFVKLLALAGATLIAMASCSNNSNVRNTEDVLNNIKTRDQIDTTRAVSPLCKAADAHVLDNDHLTRQEQMAWLINLFHVISNE